MLKSRFLQLYSVDTRNQVQELIVPVLVCGTGLRFARSCVCKGHHRPGYARSRCIDGCPDNGTKEALGIKEASDQGCNEQHSTDDIFPNVERHRYLTSFTRSARGGPWGAGSPGYNESLRFGAVKGRRYGSRC